MLNSIQLIVKFIVFIPTFILTEPVDGALEHLFKSVHADSFINEFLRLKIANGVTLVILLAILFILGFVFEYLVGLVSSQPHVFIRMIKYLLPLAYFLVWMYVMFFGLSSGDFYNFG